MLSKWSVSSLGIPTAECYASDLIGYNYKVEPGPSLSLHWKVSSPFDDISFKAVSNDSEVEWLSIGFSADGNMTGSDAVVGSSAEGVLEYYLGSKALPVQSAPTIEASISLFSEQEITSTVLEKVGNETSLSFTRPMDPKVGGKQNLPSESGTPAILLWAAGPDATFGYHSLGRGVFTVNLLCADDQPVVDEEQPSSEIVGTDPGFAPPLTLAPSVSPDILVFSVSPTVAPGSTPPPQAVDDSTTSGALPRLLQAGGGFFGLGRDNLVGDFSRAVFFGLFALGVSTASTCFVHTT